MLVFGVCDGIGGLWTALTPLPLQWEGWSSEINRDELYVLEKRFPRVESLGCIKSITKDLPRQKIA